MGTTELRELVAFGFELQKSITSSLEDGKIQFLSDAPKFLPAVMKAPKAFGGINLIMGEINTMSEEDRAEFMAWVRDEYEIEDNVSLEHLVEDTIDAILTIFKLSQRYAALVKKA